MGGPGTSSGTVGIDHQNNMPIEVLQHGSMMENKKYAGPDNFGSMLVGKPCLE